MVKQLTYALTNSRSGEGDTGRGGKLSKPNRTQQWLAPTYCSATHWKCFIAGASWAPTLELEFCSATVATRGRLRQVTPSTGRIVRLSQLHSAALPLRWVLKYIYIIASKPAFKDPKLKRPKQPVYWNTRETNRNQPASIGL